MKLHKEIRNLLTDLGIEDVENTIAWLLACYFDVNSECISNEDLNTLLKNQWIDRGVKPDTIYVKYDIFNTGELANRVPEYLAMFRKHKLYGSAPAVIPRLKEVFKKFGYDMDTVLRLADHHLKNAKYPRLPHYFLKKGKGTDLVYPIREVELELLDTTSVDDDDLLN